MKKNYLPIGININKDRIQFLELQDIKNNLKVSGFHEVVFEKNILENENFTKEELAKLQKDIFDSIKKPLYGGFHSNKVVLSIFDSQSYIKTIFLNPDQSEREDINTFVEEFIPYDRFKLTYSWSKLETSPTQNLILINAVPTQSVEQFVKLFHNLKFTIIGLDLKVNATTRAMSLTPPTYPIMIADINTSQIKISLSIKGNVCFCTQIPLQNSLENLSWEQLNEVFKADITQHLENNSLTKQFLYETKATIQEYLSLYRQNFSQLYKSNYSISNIFITGRCASIKGLEEYLKKSLKANVQVLTYDQNIKIPDPNLVSKILPATLGLALYSKNLSPNTTNLLTPHSRILLARDKFYENASKLMTGGVAYLFVCLLALIMGYVLIEKMNLEMEANQTEFENIGIKRDQQNTAIKSLNQDMDNLLSIAKKRQILSWYETLIPFIQNSNINLDNIEINRDQGTITIYGNAPSRENLISFRNTLSKEPWIETVDLPIEDLLLETNPSFNMQIKVK
jgi:Tfp pilus assembly PilM family ATPase